TVVWRRSVSAPPQTATFADVPSSHPLFQYIEALAASGITGGCGGWELLPEQSLNARTNGRLPGQSARAPLAGAVPASAAAAGPRRSGRAISSRLSRGASSPSLRDRIGRLRDAGSPRGSPVSRPGAGPAD